MRRNMRTYREMWENAVSDMNGEEVRALQGAARSAKCGVVMGVTERAGGSLYNTQVLIDGDGSLLGTRRKLKPTSAERLVWGEGDGSGLGTWAVGGDEMRLGALICGEHNLAPARFVLQAQQEQVHVASYPDPFMEGKAFADRIDSAVRHYAAEGQCFVLNATGFMSDEIRAEVYDTPELSEVLDRDPTAVRGASSIVAPDGRYLAGPLHDREGLLTAEIDIQRIPFSKFWFDPAGHSGRPDIFDLRVNLGRGLAHEWTSLTQLASPRGDAPPPPQTRRTSTSYTSSTSTSREMGFRFEVSGSVADLDDGGLDELLEAIWRHGVVCVPGQNLTADAMVGLSERIGQPVVLPACFFKGMRDPNHPEVCRVGNMLPGAETVEAAMENDDLVLKSHAVGEYWHHDGNFYASPKNAVLNALHAKVVPDVGGQTHFLDPTAALRAGGDGPFTSAEIQLLQSSTLAVSHEWISDFQGAPDEDIKPMGMPHVHRVVQPHPCTGLDCAYLPLNPDGLWNGDRHWARNKDLWGRLQDAGFFYAHAWKPGDLLLWDNLQVLHKAGGGFGDRPRLLLRTQTMYAV